MVQAAGVLFCGGGTGGHIFPALAIAQVCQKNGVEPLRWIGDPQRLEATLVPAHGIQLLPFGLSRPRLKSPIWCLKAVYLSWRTWREMSKNPPRFVIASGGYAALLPGVLAAFLHRPLIVIEPNARPGKTNRLLSCFARLVVTQFKESARYLQSDNVRVLGNPVRPIRCRDRGVDKEFCLLVMGGSLSAKSLNDVIIASLPALAEIDNLKIIHLAGADDYERVAQAYADAGMHADVRDFVQDMPTLYDSVDIALCRSGATTISELCTAGIGALYVPLPWAADDHQTANARAVAAVGGALLLQQKKLTAIILSQIIYGLNNNRDEIRALGHGAQGLAQKDVAENVWKYIQGLLASSSSGRKQ